MVDSVLPRASRTSLTSCTTVWAVGPSMVPRRRRGYSLGFLGGFFLLEFIKCKYFMQFNVYEGVVDKQ